MHINYNGDLLACTHIGPIGNIDDGDLIKTWRETALKYKKMLAKKKYFRQCHACFCDFASNYRYSLVYKPFRNFEHIMKMGTYYLNRYIEGTK